jgi:PAS domain S-box-containing protein
MHILPKILIVEDEGIIASHIASRLAKTGYEVAGIAESSDEALAQMEELHPELVLMDIRIKGERDGIETAIAIRDRFDIPVIYLTAHSDQETINRAKVTGASGFLTKPIHHTSLSTAIEMAIHKHRADRGARQQRAWMATVLGTMADAMVVIDSENNVQYLNAPAEELIGWTNDSARDRPAATVLPIADAATGVEIVESFASGGQKQSTWLMPQGMVARNRAGKWFPLEGEIALSRDGGRIVGAVITFRDATMRREQEAETRQEYKMQAIGRLAAGIAHDFNNLLFIILGYTEEMLRKSILSDSDRHSLQLVHKAGENAVGITKQLLTFSRKEPGLKVEVSLNDVIHETEELFQRLGGTKVTWNFKLDSSLGKVKADPSKLTQILMNLVSNACDAMPQPGRITIETANVEIPRSHSAVSIQDSFVSLSVTDTGTGMSAETAEHLFEPFFTTREPGKGTGLGLSIVHSIVTDLGGSISAESEPGKGACFTVFLPRAGVETAPPELQESNDSPGPATVMIAEDQDGIRSLLSSWLTSAGYKVIEAENGEEAIRLAREYPGPIDMLVGNVMMPRAGGFEVARALASVRSGMHTVLISGYAQELIDERETLPPGARFLPKPFARADFLKNVSDLLIQARKKQFTKSAS